MLEDVVVLQEGGGGNLKQQLAKVFEISLRATVPSEADVEPLIAPGKFGDYQWYVVAVVVN